MSQELRAPSRVWMLFFLPHPWVLTRLLPWKRVGP